MELDFFERMEQDRSEAAVKIPHAGFTFFVLHPSMAQYETLMADARLHADRFMLGQPDLLKSEPVPPDRWQKISKNQDGETARIQQPSNLWELTWQEQYLSRLGIETIAVSVRDSEMKEPWRRSDEKLRAQAGKEFPGFSALEPADQMPILSKLADTNKQVFLDWLFNQPDLVEKVQNALKKNPAVTRGKQRKARKA